MNNDNIIHYDNDYNYSLSIHKKNNGKQQEKHNKIKWRILYAYGIYQSKGACYFM